MLKPHRVGRLSLWFGLALAGATLLSGLLVLGIAHRQLNEQVNQWLAGDAAMLRPYGDATTVAQALRRHAEWQSGHSFSEKAHIVFAGDGRIVSPGAITMAPPPLGYSEARFRDGPRAREGRALTLPLAQGGRLVVIAHSEIDTAARRLLLPAILASVVAAALAAAIGSRYFARAIARRIAGIQSAADAIAHGDLARRLPVETLDGLFAEQAQSLNRMLDRLDGTVRSQRQFASHVAHDLRTPLTRLRATLSEAQGANGDGLAALVDRADRECAAMITTFDALLRLAEIESGRSSLGLASLDLAHLIEDVAETMEPVLADAGCTLQLGSLQQAAINGDDALLQQMLVNLLENVVLHTPAGTCVHISLRQDEAHGHACLTIADNGPGITQRLRGEADQPFVRGEQEHAHGHGHGLGLAIVQAIARFHGGRLELEDAKPGLAAVIILPLQQGVTTAKM